MQITHHAEKLEEGDAASPTDGIANVPHLSALLQLTPEPTTPSLFASPDFATRAATAGVIEPLRHFICKHPSEWDASDLETRYAEPRKPDKPLHGDNTPWKDFKGHAEKMAFWPQAGLADRSAWHFHPLQFIQHYRKCLWFSENEMKQIVPRRALRGIGADIPNRIVYENTQPRCISPATVANRWMRAIWRAIAAHKTPNCQSARAFPLPLFERIMDKHPRQKHVIVPVFMWVLVAVFCSLPTMTWADTIERSWNIDPNTAGVHCEAYSRADHYHEYRNPKYIPNPNPSDITLLREVNGGKYLPLNLTQCQRFLDTDPNTRFVNAGSDKTIWYDKHEFIHDSEMIPIDRWTTRYIYLNETYTYTNSELVPSKDERRFDLALSYNSYTLSHYKNNLHQFSDDGYYLTQETNIRWRFVYMPGIDPTSTNKDGNAKIFLVDESGRYLPRGYSPPFGSEYNFTCTKMHDGGIICGYTPRIHPYRHHSDWGYIRNITPKFTPVTISSDKVTITRRVSYGEQFWPPGAKKEGQGDTMLFLYANFDDPIRPVIIAPGVLLYDRDKGYAPGRMPKKKDFVQEEICLADCPEDIQWQYSSLRKKAAHTP